MNDVRLPDGRAVTLTVEAGLVVGMDPAIGEPDLELYPPLLDLQVNGYGGLDVNDPEVTWETIAGLTRALRKVGTVQYCPTVITAGEQDMIRSFAAIALACERDPLSARAIVGIHAEGPFISESPGAVGAHDPRLVRDPDLDEFGRWQVASGGRIRIVTVAPELPGATQFIRALARMGLTVSLGHSAASPEEIRSGVLAGARSSTHLGNGAPAVSFRDPSLLWTQLATDELSMGVIADGCHLSPDVFVAMVRAKGVNNTFVVSDSVALAGAPAGNYSTPVGGEVQVGHDGGIRLKSGLLAGSGVCLAQCISWMARSTPLSHVERATLVSANPRRMLGLPAVSVHLGSDARDIAVRSTTTDHTFLAFGED